MDQTNSIPWTTPLAAASAAFALILAFPAFAGAANTIVTGWQTGYSYHEGLANGSGAYLVARADQTAVSQNTVQSANTNATPAAPNTGQDANTSQAAAPQVTAPSGAQLSDNTTPSPSPTYDMSQSNIPAAPNTGAAAPSLTSLPAGTWVAIALLALAIIALIALLSSSRYTRTVERTYNRRYGSF